MMRQLVLGFFSLMVLTSAVQAECDLPWPDWFPQAAPWPEPEGPIIRVSTVEELFRAAETVPPGGTILVGDGHYRMPRYLELRTDRVTLRGASGRPERVILDAVDSRHGELLGITGCAGVTVAHVTLQNVRWNALKINSNLRATQVTVYHCIFRNVWQRAIKGPAVPADQRAEFRPSDCRIQYCLFTNDRVKRYEDDPADTPENFRGNYVGGIDAMFPRRWTISDNVFIGIRGRTGEGRGAIFLWHDAQDCVIERNLLLDCDSGICLGNSHRPADIDVHCRRCLVRNNFVVRCSQNGILADYTEHCRILHNSIHDPESRLKRLIRLVHDNSGLIVANNLLSGPPPRIETSDDVELRDNAIGDFTTVFRGAVAGDLHLARALPEIVDAGQPWSEVPEDIDRQPRGPRPDLGADEFDH
jgi:hypothetical protein